jgi:adenosylhomocysteine nucleosidase
MSTIGRMRAGRDRIGPGAPEGKAMGIAADPLPAAPAGGSWPAAVEAGIGVPAAHQLDLAAAETQRLGEARTARLGVIVSLQTEADCLRRCPGDGSPLIFVSGGSALRARAGAEGLRDHGAIALVSFGMAVGLAPVLRPGDVVLADNVVLPGGRSVATDPSWRGAVLQRFVGSGVNVRVARIAGSDELPASAGAKRRMFQTTFAAALDTDSHAVAEVAAAAGLPLLVVRAVSEPAEEMRPAVAVTANDADGHPRGLAVVGHLAMRPWEIPAAWRFSRNGRLALDALRRIIPSGPDPFAFARG